PLKPMSMSSFRDSGMTIDLLFVESLTGDIMEIGESVDRVVEIIRRATFDAFLWLRPAVRMVLNWICYVAFFCFLFIVAFASQEILPMRVFAGIGLGATLLLWVYDTAITLLAPRGYELVTKL
ncbi:MAG: hypothetical protein VB141_13600, partial [Burkholderia gladioli]